MPSERIEEAKTILAALGMPSAQRNDNAAYTLLACADVGPRTPWARARALRVTPHMVIQLARERYRKNYAENTRETIRRQAMHQFVQGGILHRNPDEPGLATNSPRTHYALTDEALEVIRAHGSPLFEAAAVSFLVKVGGGLAVRYAGKRRAAGLEVVLPDGEQIVLSPGGHNQLQVDILRELLPRYAAGTSILYMGDTDHKSLHMDAATLALMGIPVTKHDKLPDIVAYDAVRQWLFLIEAVTSHGPVSPKRHVELEELLRGCSVGRVYISAFASFREYKKHAANVAWETEVWIAEVPEHLLHYNGDRFFGPR
jgi:type II restriction enzyme